MTFLSNIIDLDLSLNRNVESADVAILPILCPNLQSLDLGGCTRITDEGLELMLQRLPSLRRLNIASCVTEALNITDHTLWSIALNCPDITQ